MQGKCWPILSTDISYVLIWILIFTGHCKNKTLATNCFSARMSFWTTEAIVKQSSILPPSHTCLCQKCLVITFWGIISYWYLIFLLFFWLNNIGISICLQEILYRSGSNHKCITCHFSKASSSLCWLDQTLLDCSGPKWYEGVLKKKKSNKNMVDNYVTTKTLLFLAIRIHT